MFCVWDTTTNKPAEEASDLVYIDLKLDKAFECTQTLNRDKPKFKLRLLRPYRSSFNDNDLTRTRRTPFTSGWARPLGGGSRPQGPLGLRRRVTQRTEKPKIRRIRASSLFRSAAGRNSQNKTRPLTTVPALFSNAFMPHWPDKIVQAVMFDIGFALNFKVGRTFRPRSPTWSARWSPRKSWTTCATIELGD